MCRARKSHSWLGTLILCVFLSFVMIWFAFIICIIFLLFSLFVLISLFVLNALLWFFVFCLLGTSRAIGTLHGQPPLPSLLLGTELHSIIHHPPPAGGNQYQNPDENVVLSAKWNVHIWTWLRCCASRYYTGTLKTPWVLDFSVPNS